MVTVFSPRWSPACLFLGYSYRNYSQFHTAKLLCSHKQKTAVGIKRFKNVCVYAGGRKVHARWFLIAGSCVFTKFETLSLLPSTPPRFCYHNGSVAPRLRRDILPVFVQLCSDHYRAYHTEMVMLPTPVDKELGTSGDLAYITMIR